ncbi:MAG: hypothetical protein RMJ48_05920 [Roseiflexaceae bacterium]|nr:hypothetical protein [Roseiflexaceae bacterium]
MNQTIKSSLTSLPGTETSARQRLECLNGWRKRPLLMLETINQPAASQNTGLFS